MERNSRSRRAAPGPDLLKTLCRRHGVDLDQEKVEKLWRFHQLLRERNRELNMTRIHNFENMVVKHYVDCMLVARMVDLPSPLLDIGTGPGFPAIPLKIIRPDLHLILAEGRKKRVAFLEEAVELLGLEGVEVLGRKIEKEFQRPVAGVITRAVEKVAETLERVKGCLEKGGLVLFMKGPKCEAEAEEAMERHGNDFEALQGKTYTLPGTPHKRRLLLFRRKTSPMHLAMKIKEITSLSNKTFALFQKLSTTRGIRKAGQAILLGRKIVEEALSDHPDLCRGWIHEKGHPSPPVVPRRLIGYRVPHALFRELDVHGTNAPLLLVDLPAIPEWDPKRARPGCTLFIPFQDPENVGSVIRSAAAFGVSAIVLLKEAAHPFLPKACRAAGSALLKVPLFFGPSLSDLALEGPPILSLSPKGTDLRTFRFPHTFGLLAGMEGQGLPPGLKGEQALAIPMEGGCESLNAAASVSIALYAWRSGTPSSR